MRLQALGEIAGRGIELHDPALDVSRELERWREQRHRAVHVEHVGEAGRLHGLRRRRVTVAEEHVRGTAVRPGADEECGGIGPGVGEDGKAGRRLPAVLDEVDARLLPLRPQPSEAMHATLAAQRPHVDVLAADARIRGLDPIDIVRAEEVHVSAIYTLVQGLGQLFGPLPSR